MPSWEIFRAQPASYRAEVLPPAITARVSIEAGVTMGWSEWLAGGTAIGIDRFGASAPGEVLLAELGINIAAVVTAAVAAVGAARRA
jgi:transketolase